MLFSICLVHHVWPKQLTKTQCDARNDMILNETASHRPPLQQLRLDADCLLVHHINYNSNLPEVQVRPDKTNQICFCFCCGFRFSNFRTNSNLGKEGYIQQITSFKLWIYRYKLIKMLIVDFEFDRSQNQVDV